MYTCKTVFSLHEVNDGNRALRTNVTDPHFTFALVRASHTESTSELINNPRKSHSEVGHGTKYVQSTLTEDSQDKKRYGSARDSAFRRRVFVTGSTSYADERL